MSYPSYYSRNGAPDGLPLASAKQYDVNHFSKAPTFYHQSIHPRFIDPGVRSFNNVINYASRWYNLRSGTLINQSKIPPPFSIPTSLIPNKRVEEKKSRYIPVKDKEENNVEIFINEPIRIETKLPVSVTTTQY